MHTIKPRVRDCGGVIRRFHFTRAFRLPDQIGLFRVQRDIATQPVVDKELIRCGALGSWAAVGEWAEM